MENKSVQSAGEKKAIQKKKNGVPRHQAPKSDEVLGTRKLVLAAMLAAVAYVVMVVGRFPLVPSDFLRYDPKDVVILLGGCILGPVAALLITAVVSFVEMVTVSTTGPIGFAMNVVSTLAFVLPATVIFRRFRENNDIVAAVAGLVCSVAFMTGVMLLWNYALTPIYQGFPREAVVPMLWSTFLPFNLLKGGINAAVFLILFKPLKLALGAMGFGIKREENESLVIWIIVGVAALATLVLIVLSLLGKI